ALLLKRIVADRFGRAHPLLEVALLHHGLPLRIPGVRRPDAGIAVSLELDPDLDCVALGLARAGLELFGLPERADQVLDVMTDLVRDDIGLGEIARRLESARELTEKFGV